MTGITEVLPLLLGNLGALVLSLIGNVFLYRELLKSQGRLEKVDSQADVMLEMLKKVIANQEMQEKIRDALMADRERWERWREARGDA